MCKTSQYFPKPYKSFGGDINVKVDLSHYATKADVKNITYVDTSSFALKTNLGNIKTEVDKLGSLPNNLSNLKAKVDKLDINKLAPVPTDLSKLSDEVKNEVVKKTEYNAKIIKYQILIEELYQIKRKTCPLQKN